MEQGIHITSDHGSPITMRPMLAIDPATYERFIDLEAEVKRSHSRLEERDSEVAGLQEKIQSNDQEIAELHQKLRRMEVSHNKTIQALEDHIMQLETRRIELEREIEKHRFYIANIKIVEEQMRTDTYYFENLQGLNQSIQLLVADLFIDVRKPLSNEAGLRVLKILAGIPVHGGRITTVLEKTLWHAYDDQVKRVAFVRHIFALFLWDAVFHPLAFGLSAEESVKLRKLEDHMIANGILTLFV